MASSVMLRALIARAAAPLSTQEQIGAPLDLCEAYEGQASVELAFTRAQATNVVVRFYASMDGVKWFPVTDAAGHQAEDSVSDDNAARCYVMPNLSGWKFLAASVQGNGNVAGTSCALTYRYIRRH